MKSVAGFSTYDDLGSPYKLNISSRGFYSSPVVGSAAGHRRLPRRRPDERAGGLAGQFRPAADGSHQPHRDPLGQRLAARAERARWRDEPRHRSRAPGPPSGTIELSGGSYGAARGEAHVSGLHAGGLDWYIGRRTTTARTAGGRIPARERYQGFVNVGKLGRDERYPIPGLLLARQRRDRGLAARIHLRAERRLQSQRRGLREALGLPGLAPGVQAVRARPCLGHRVFPPPPRRAVQRRIRQTIRTRSAISYNTSFGYTADYRWTTVINDRTALSLRGGVDGEVTRVEDRHLRRLDQVRWDANTHARRARSPLWDIAPFAAADLIDRQGDAVGGRPVRLRADSVRERARSLARHGRDVYKRFNPRIGASVEVAPGGSVFASWGQAFRAPAVIENACADPEICRVRCPSLSVTIRRSSRSRRAPWRPASGTRRIAIPCPVRCTTPSVKNDIFLTPFGEADEPAAAPSTDTS